jgi:hypothetical protein
MHVNSELCMREQSGGTMCLSPAYLSCYVLLLVVLPHACVSDGHARNAVRGERHSEGFFRC